MTHDPLWAPWRLAYIKNEPQPAHEEKCFLCRYQESDEDQENLVVARSKHSLVVLNRFPYNNGHLLIAPNAHIGSFQDLSDDQLLDSQRLIRKFLELLGQMNPDGFNVGLNLGKVAGAGLPGHLHWHIVPRWDGDTNFMPVLADTKVIPQSLHALYELLTKAAADAV